MKLVALLVLTSCAVLSAFVPAARQGPPYDTVLADGKGPPYDGVPAVRGAPLYDAAAQDGPAGVLVSRDVYLMGTRARLSTYAVTHDSGLATLESALAVLEDAEEELSTWRASSEMSALNRQPVGEPWIADARLCRMFSDVWEWHHATDGAFDPSIGRLLAAWDVRGEGIVPSREAHARARALSGMALLAFDPGRCALTRRADVSLDEGAFGKGEALDRAAAVLGDRPWMIDLGGQISVGGRVPPEGAWPIGIADPRRRDHPALQVRMVTGSLSTSAGSERDLVVNGERVGHIFDPRTGRPATFNGSVTVWHERGLAADALSTALYVMGPEAGLRWARRQGIAACYLIPERGMLRVETTRAFRRLVTTSSLRKPQGESPKSQVPTNPNSQIENHKSQLPTAPG